MGFIICNCIYPLPICSNSCFKDIHSFETFHFLQLRCVFDACDTSGTGYISLRQLANISRSHVSGASQVRTRFCYPLCRFDFPWQVEQILDIFDAGEDGSRDDQLDFGQFHCKVHYTNLYICLILRHINNSH